MAVFPTIYLDAGNSIAQHPTVSDLEDTLAFDPVVRTRFESGYAATRARSTHLPRKWVIVYRGATQTGKNLIKAFENTHVGGSLSFTWTNPEDSTGYYVRFLEPVIYTPWVNANYQRWDVSFILEQL